MFTQSPTPTSTTPRTTLHDEEPLNREGYSLHHASMAGQDVSQSRSTQHRCLGDSVNCSAFNLAEWVRRSTQASGVPERVEDLETLRVAAGLITRASGSAPSLDQSRRLSLSQGQSNGTHLDDLAG